MLKMLIFVAAAAFSTNLYAQGKMTAEDLVYICDGTGEPDLAFCQAYIAGVSEGGYTSAAFFLLETRGDAEFTLDDISKITQICYDGTTTTEKVVPQVIETIKKNKNLINSEASVAVTYSLRLLFSCG